MRELSRSDIQAVSGGANLFEIVGGLLIAPVMAVFLQQQVRDHAGKDISYWEALGTLVGSLFTS
ncbi:MAG: hypothetical protein QM742_01380 [Aquabacterium sp.]